MSYYKVLVSEECNVYCCKYCNNFWSKLIGLRFKKGFGTWDAYLFKVSEDAFMDSFFVKFGFNIYWLDEECKVVKKEEVKEGDNKILSPVSGQCFVLETPIRSRFELGDCFKLF